MTADERIAPHKRLDEYYQTESERQGLLSHLFDSAAPHYDRISSMLSFGSGAWYRRYALRNAGLSPGMRVLDVATGTGLVARPEVELTKSRRNVFGLDPSRGMLTEARRTVGHPTVQGRAEKLPFRTGSFDFLTMGYALRHVPDLSATFAEYRRVLRPEGTLLVLDFRRPSHRTGYRLARMYLEKILPSLARWRSGTGEAKRLMEYCWDTVDQCVPIDRTVSAISGAGFEDVRTVSWFGVMIEYHARKGNNGRGNVVS